MACQSSFKYCFHSVFILNLEWPLDEFKQVYLGLILSHDMACIKVQTSRRDSILTKGVFIHFLISAKNFF